MESDLLGLKSIPIKDALFSPKRGEVWLAIREHWLLSCSRGFLSTKDPREQLLKSTLINVN